MFVTNLRFKKTLKFIVIGIIFSSESLGFCSDNYYSNMGVSLGKNRKNTYDSNIVEATYPYNFSSIGTKLALGFGKHINESFDVGIEFSRFSNLKHSYKGPIMQNDPQPYEDYTPIVSAPQDRQANADQKIFSTTFMLSGKYKKNLSLFSTSSDLYLKGGLGLALNNGGDYTRRLSKTFKMVYPKHTRKDLAFNFGIGLERKINSFTVGLGYDFYNLGKFRTKDKITFFNVENQPIKTEIIEGKRLKPRLTIHSISLNLSFDF